MTDSADLLIQSSFFHRLDPEEAKALAAVMDDMSFEEGKTIFNFGDRGGYLYLIRKGRVEFSIKDHSGEKIILNVAGPGDVCGETSMLDGGPRTASAVVLEECELIALSQKELLEFLHNKPEAALDLLAVLGDRIRQTNNLLRGRVTRNMNVEVKEELNWAQRIANFIAIFSGSMPFLMMNAGIFFLWIILNLGIIPGVQAFDPYPFGFLTMAVSLEAIFLSIFLLLAQNLQSAKDRIRGDIEYDVNLKAELEVAYLHEKVDQMNSRMLNAISEIEKVLRKN